MLFNKRQIGEFKAKHRYYITWQNSITPKQIKNIFYNDNVELGIKQLFPDKNIKYCYSYMYDIVVGDYQLGVKFVDEKESYYMFWSANSFYSYPHSIAIGKAVDGIIYFICEHFPNGEYNLNFREIPEEYINKNEYGFRPKSYNKTINSVHLNLEDITEEDIKCIKIAYDAIKTFSKLIEECSV